MPVGSPDKDLLCPYGVRSFAPHGHAVPLLCARIRRTSALVSRLGGRILLVKALLLCDLGRFRSKTSAGSAFQSRFGGQEIRSGQVGLPWGVKG